MKTLGTRIPTLGATPSGWKPDQVRGNRHQRGYGTAWEKLREDIMRRDHGMCQPCLRSGHTTIATQVDHIVQKADGGTDDPANLQAICEPCHREKTSRESNRTGGA